MSAAGPFRTYDAIVVGAGIIGCAISLELGRAGWRVLCVDAGPTAGSGSTGASSAIVRFHYTDAEAATVAWDSYADWTNWADYVDLPPGEPLARYVTTGALVLDAPVSPRRATLAHFDALGIPYQELTAADIRGLFPEICTESFWPPRTPEDHRFWDPGRGELGGYLTPAAGYVDDPQLATANLMAAATRAGVTFQFRRLVRRVIVAGDRAAGVELDGQETVSAPVVVNTCGPASDLLNQLAGVTGDMAVRSRPLRTETHEVPAPAGFRTGRGGVFVTDADLGVAFRPHGQDRLHISSMEPACDPLEWIDDPWSYRHTPTQACYDRQTLRVARRLPGLSIPSRPSGIGALYDVTPDWRAIFDRSALPGYYLACGTSGNSFKIGPMAGRIVAAIIDACEAGHDHDRDPVLFTTPHRGRPVSLGYYSRLREVAPDAPHNVIA
jgi:sarcosine oxidase subunit beta